MGSVPPPPDHFFGVLGAIFCIWAVFGPDHFGFISKSIMAGVDSVPARAGLISLNPPVVFKNDCHV